MTNFGDVSADEWRRVMEQSTAVSPTCLQWFLPVRLRGDHAPSSGQTPLGSWALQGIRKRDFRAYEQSLTKVIEKAATSGSDGKPDSAGAKSRMRIFRFEPAEVWRDTVTEYPDRFRRLFQLSGTKLDPEPEVVRVGLFEFDSGDATSRYVGVTMRFPLGQPGTSKQAWSLGDVIDLNYQLVGSEMGGEPDESDDALLGTVQPTASWRVSRGGSSPDATDAMEWKHFLAGILASTSGDPDRVVGPLVIDHGTRAVCMTSVVVDGDLDRDSAIRVAEHLGASMRSTTIPDRPLGVHTAESLPDSLFEQSDRQWYVVTQRATALVINPTGSAPERLEYLLKTLPKEYQTQNSLLYLLALHQKRALSGILEGLSDIDLIPADSGSGGGPSSGEASDLLGEQLVTLRAIQHSFYQLQAWTRYRLVSPRFGTQGFYDLVCRHYRIQDIYADVDNIIDGLEGFLRVRLSELEQRISREQADSQRAFERRVQVFGVVFAVVAVVLAFFSINIRGLTAEGEGLGSGIAVVMVVGLLLAAAGLAFLGLRLVRRFSRTSG